MSIFTFTDEYGNPVGFVRGPVPAQASAASGPWTKGSPGAGEPIGEGLVTGGSLRR